jgi:carboxypeptidase Taq
MKEHLPTEYGASSPESIWQRLNYVTPSLIRVESDEVTYSLHVVIRLLLEAEIFTEELPVEELPTRWNELYREYLGVEVPNNRLGILQDVHWYGVGFGYFPTYALGNLYSAIMMDQIRKELPSVDEDIARGEFSHILHWLNKNVHEHGMRYRGPVLVEKLSGEQLSEKPFLKYLRDKFQSWT